ncbi:MAG TPA: VOC family protein [Jatrophihabitans sp.]|jgi:catechol 2,3-dioxygenase-like lactoylglutathione lyase family enzyme|uniref:VOC family protein n=1 Tax=Jatrophihabitans sp. TaxID=1932789 RepID=UPI002EEB747E
MSSEPPQPLFRAVDAVVVRVPSLEEGLAFYHDALGHELLWRTETKVALGFGDAETELVLALDVGPETDLLVESVEDAVAAMALAGGSLVAGPDDIAVGKVAVVKDPFGNQLTLVDLTKGRLRPGG